MQQQWTISTKRLSKEFDGQIALNNLKIQVAKGEIYGILGANGAGKTTLLKLIGGLLEPSEGSAYVLGKNTWQERDQVLGTIGSLIEVPVFYEHLSAGDNLAIHLAYMNAQAPLQKTLELVGLNDVGDKPVSKFSLGMRQRLAIARSIIHRPKVLLLDEPTNGLDPVAIREMRALFIMLKNQGMTILLSSHILSEMIQTVDKIAVIDKGCLTLEANMSDLLNEQQNNLEEYLISQMSGGKKS